MYKFYFKETNFVLYLHSKNISIEIYVKNSYSKTYHSLSSILFETGDYMIDCLNQEVLDDIQTQYTLFLLKN